MQTTRVLVDFSYLLTVIPFVCGIIKLRHPRGTFPLALITCSLKSVFLALILLTLHFSIEFHGVLFNPLMISECSGLPTGAQLMLFSAHFLLFIHVLYYSS